MITADVDTSRLHILMSQFARESRKGMDEIIKKQTATIVGHLISFTPPAKTKGKNLTKGGGISKHAKELGENRMKAEINSLFPTTTLKSEEVWGMIENGFRWGTGRGAKKIGEYAESVADLKRVHRKSRSRTTGRVKTGTIGQNMALTKKSILNAYIKDQIKDVGMLNAGWLRAANELGTSKRQVPAWIRRHGNMPGGVKQRNSKHGFYITVSNRMSYFPKNMASRMQAAVHRRENGLEIALEAMFLRKAQKINQKMRNK
tara:strand:+ start:222 stop:1001 length:780 start_codon:yes stop_codon:yes gene_type:complete